VTTLITTSAVRPEWPAGLAELTRRSLASEYASLTRDGRPITWPVTPYLGEDGATVDVSTGLTYPSKAERARRDPRVAVLLSSGAASGVPDAPVVLVQGLATVRDADLQANTDRYLSLALAKLSTAYEGLPPFVLRRLGWYWARIWIEVTPLRILWWPGGRLDSPPRRWVAPPGTVAPPSDPPPAGRSAPAWKDAPLEWRPRAAHAARALGVPVLTTVDEEGFPLPVRARAVAPDPEGFQLTLPAGLSLPGAGQRNPACLTFHTHDEEFTGQENATFVGEIEPDGDGARFRVERCLADWSLPGSRLQRSWSFLSAGRRLRRTVVAEAARRGQQVPEVRLPH
jgi:hypothetical protein